MSGYGRDVGLLWVSGRRLQGSSSCSAASSTRSIARRTREALADPERSGAWLPTRDSRMRTLQVRPADLRRAIDVREALRAVLLAHNGRRAPRSTSAAATLDAAAKRARVRLHFDARMRSVARARRRRRRRRARPSAGDRARGDGRGDVVAAEGMPRAQLRVGVLRRDAEPLRTWCDMQVCGNRAKARAYRDRHGALLIIRQLQTPRGVSGWVPTCRVSAATTVSSRTARSAHASRRSSCVRSSPRAPPLEPAANALVDGPQHRVHARGARRGGRARPAGRGPGAAPAARC